MMLTRIWRQVYVVVPALSRRSLLTARFSSSKSKMPSQTEEAVSGTPLLKFKRTSENAKTPTKGSPWSAGFDLYSAEDVTVPAKGKALVKTDIQIAVPHGYYGRIAPRSGLAHKHFIDVGAGVIDEDYRGNVGVILFNFSQDDDFKVSKGDRIAQLVCEKICYPDILEVNELDDTDRGGSGFGSTGKK